MKKIILIISLLIYGSTTAQKYVKAEFRKTNYKPGFTYYDSRGIKCTLIKWEKVGGMIANERRWRAKFECMGETSYGWTDDCWIDLYTGKAFLNERNHQIIYYDEVNITLKTN